MALENGQRSRKERELAKIAANPRKKWEKEQEMGKWRTEEQEEEEKCPVKW